MIEYRYRLLRTGIVLAIVWTLGACASTPHHSDAQDQLITHITATGLKQFTFIETPQRSSSGWHGHGGMGSGMGHMGGGGGMGGGMAGGGGMHGGGMGADYPQNHADQLKRLEVAVKQRLEAKLAAAAYCRNSYTELSSQVQHGQIQINGECVEPATAQDRIRFPNAVP